MRMLRNATLNIAAEAQNWKYVTGSRQTNGVRVVWNAGGDVSAAKFAPSGCHEGFGEVDAAVEYHHIWSQKVPGSLDSRTWLWFIIRRGFNSDIMFI